MLIGYVELPKMALDDTGLIWRKASIIFSALLILIGFTFDVQDMNGGQCFGINS